jgi:hypothetical protein
LKIKHQNYDEERAVLIGMIVDKVVLSRVTAKWSDSMFRSPWANRISRWCAKYYKRYQKAPGPHIQSIFETWATDSRNKDTVEIIGKFLDSLSNQYKRLRRESNSNYVVDTAARYFNKVKLEKLSQAIESDISQGEVDKAERRAIDYHKIEMGVGASIDVFDDKDNIQAAFEEKHDSIISYPDGLGKFFGDRLERDGLIAFMGPDKRGKSFWLLDAAFRAVIQKRRVAFFECGDLSQNQIMRRFMVRVARHPIKPERVKYPKSIKIRPRPKQEPLVHIPVQRRRYKNALTWRKAYKACKALTDGRGLKSKLRLSCHFNDTLTMDGIRNALDEWERDDWIPDIIAIDYADILNMDHEGLEGRDRIDHVWKQLRRLSQEKHCLVLTATQSDSKAYDAYRIGRKHFSDDKRKNAHVTGMVGLNQTPKEKEKGYMRLNWVVLREGWYSERRCCYVATCFELANMAVRSVF